MITKIEHPSENYTGRRGADYFSYQKPYGRYFYRNMPVWSKHVDPDDILVEFGCGGGDLLKALPARRKVGVEINPEAIRYASELGLEVHEGLGHLPDAAFTKAISSHALEHVASPYDVLRELYRVLQPSGRLVLLLPMDDWRAAALRRYRPDDRDMHLYSWTPQGLGNLLACSGFLPISVRIVNQAWPPRFGDLLWKVHPSLFHAASHLTSICLRRRQLLAVAEKPERP
jgi:SAM-dependent methyltransferase